jgi:hypothetical protein
MKIGSWIGNLLTAGKVLVAIATILPISIAYKLGYEAGQNSLLPDVDEQTENAELIADYELKIARATARHEREYAKLYEQLEKAREAYVLQPVPPYIVRCYLQRKRVCLPEDQD